MYKILIAFSFIFQGELVGQEMSTAPKDVEVNHSKEAFVLFNSSYEKMKQAAKDQYLFTLSHFKIKNKMYVVGAEDQNVDTFDAFIHFDRKNHHALKNVSMKFGPTGMSFTIAHINQDIFLSTEASKDSYVQMSFAGLNSLVESLGGIETFIPYQYFLYKTKDSKEAIEYLAPGVMKDVKLDQIESLTQNINGSDTVITRLYFSGNSIDPMSPQRPKGYLDLTKDLEIKTIVIEQSFPAALLGGGPEDDDITMRFERLISKNEPPAPKYVVEFEVKDKKKHESLAALMQSMSPPVPEAIKNGTEAPAWTLEDSEGNSFSLKDYSGEVLVIDMWATWCKPCMIALPHLEEVYLWSRQHKEADRINIIPIHVWGQGGKEKITKDALKALKDIKVTMIPLFSYNDSFPSSYGVTGIPALFIIGKDGKIVASHSGFSSDPKKYKEDIKREIESALK